VQQRIVVMDFGLCNLLLDLPQLGIAIQHEVERRLAAAGAVLCHIRNGTVDRQADAAFVGFEATQHQFKQRRLAAAIGTGQAHFLAGVQLETGSFKQDAAAAHQSDIIELQHRADRTLPGWPVLYGLIPKLGLTAENP
jgi:hypothetical protein